ncbi:hypothetical protein P692DRAFT_20644414, partial [Suillus brevipes Sb2]
YADIPLQSIARKNRALSDLLSVRVSFFTHYITHPPPSLQPDAARPTAGRRKPPIHAIPMVQRPPPTIHPQQPMFLRLSKLLRFSHSNPVHHDRPRDPLDVC